MQPCRVVSAAIQCILLSSASLPPGILLTVVAELVGTALTGAWSNITSIPNQTVLVCAVSVRLGHHWHALDLP